MLVIFIRSLLLYALLCLVMRVMGKREVGQLQPYEFVIALVSADLASAPMGDASVPLLHGVISVLALLFAHMLASYLSLKSARVRDVINGRPVILIANGRLMEGEMRKLRYNLNDLMEQLRDKDVFSVTDVQYAILETRGQLNVLLKPSVRTLTPADIGLFTPDTPLTYNVIIDGKLNRQTLYESGHDLPWLQEQMALQGFSRVQQIFFGAVSGDTVYLQESNAKVGRWFS